MICKYLLIFMVLFFNSFIFAEQTITFKNTESQKQQELLNLLGSIQKSKEENKTKHPLKRNIGFHNNMSNIQKTIFYIKNNDIKSIEWILKENNKDEKTTVNLIEKEKIYIDEYLSNGKYSVISSTLRLKNLEIFKLIIDHIIIIPNNEELINGIKKIFEIYDDKKYESFLNYFNSKIKDKNVNL